MIAPSMARRILFGGPGICHGRLDEAPWRRDWWTWAVSNRLPPRCRRGALPVELQARIQGEIRHSAATRQLTSTFHVPKRLVQVAGFEPAASCSRSRRSAKLSYTRVFGTGGWRWIRTTAGSMSHLGYSQAPSASRSAIQIVAGDAGFEPARPVRGSRLANERFRPLSQSPEYSQTQTQTSNGGRRWTRTSDLPVISRTLCTLS